MVGKVARRRKSQKKDNKQHTKAHNDVPQTPDSWALTYLLSQRLLPPSQVRMLHPPSTACTYRQ